MTTERDISVAVIGANGYTGGELLRLLAQHPRLRVTHATSRSLSGQPVRGSFPHLRTDLRFCEYNAADIAAQCALAFLCLPHGESAATAEELAKFKSIKVVDLSADLRYDDLALFRQSYGEHVSPLAGSVPYGLTEWNREAVRSAQIVANPGCYVTTILLALMPLWRSELTLHGPVIADAKSGVSGAGRGASVPNLLAELAGDFYPYKTVGHRHESEIRHRLTTLGAARSTPVIFSPHLLPIPRGILASVYVQCDADSATMHQLYREAYAHEPMISLLDKDETIHLKAVQGTNRTLIKLVHRPAEKAWVIFSALDNLVKGASGQALQNANLMLGLPETMGLDTLAVYP